MDQPEKTQALGKERAQLELVVEEMEVLALICVI